MDIKIRDGDELTVVDPVTLQPLRTENLGTNSLTYDTRFAALLRSCESEREAEDLVYSHAPADWTERRHLVLVHVYDLVSPTAEVECTQCLGRATCDPPRTDPEGWCYGMARFRCDVCDEDRSDQCYRVYVRDEWARMLFHACSWEHARYLVEGELDLDKPLVPCLTSDPDIGKRAHRMVTDALDPYMASRFQAHDLAAQVCQVLLHEPETAANPWDVALMLMPGAIRPGISKVSHRIRAAEQVSAIITQLGPELEREVAA